MQTIRKLEEAGVLDLKGLLQLGRDGMARIGIGKGIAKRIQIYLRRRAF